MNTTQRELARLLLTTLLLDTLPGRRRRLTVRERTWTTITLIELLAEL